MIKSYIDHFAPVTPVFGPRKSLSYVDHVAPLKPTIGVSQSDSYTSHFPTPIAPPEVPVAAPPQAIAVGFTDLNFDQESVPGVPWDIGFGPNGHKWQAGLWYQSIPHPNSFSYDSSGILTITDYTNAVVGTSICTQYHDYSGGIYFQGGYFEAMMWCTDWSAFWMYIARGPLGLPINPADPTTWTSEIDIIETDPSPGFFDSLFCNVHKNTGGSGGVPDTGGPGTLSVGIPVVGAWHIFGCLWTTTLVSFYLDNVLAGSIPPWASTVQPMNLILSAQPGGVQNVGGSPYPGSVTPPITKVQWVRVWEPPGYVNPPI